LVGVLFAQVLGLAVQVKRTSDSEPTRLIRVWAVGTIAPLEKALAWVQTSSSDLWHNYFYLRGVRAENRRLKGQLERMSIDQARMSQDADQARRLQALLSFKEQFISQTMAAQVIGASGSELSRSVYIDKGEKDHIKTDMAVITADGIVGKVLRVYRSTSQVLLINDQTSGVGALLDKTRLQGILRGTSAGEAVLEKVMSDETVPGGELVLTSGGDGVFPKGLLVGRVTKVSAGNDLFLNIHVRPAADLSKLEEVLVVTKIDERQTEPDQTGAARAVDILAERLPTVPAKVETPENGGVAPKTALPNIERGQAGTVQPGSNVKPKATTTTAVSGATPVAGKTPAGKTGAGTTSEGGSTAGSERSPKTPSAIGSSATNSDSATTPKAVSPKPVVPKPVAPETTAPKTVSPTAPPAEAQDSPN
jgi:rod shape-determining protein MreC